MAKDTKKTLVELKMNCPFGKIGEVVEVDESFIAAYGKESCEKASAEQKKAYDDARKEEQARIDAHAKQVAEEKKAQDNAQEDEEVVEDEEEELEEIDEEDLEEDEIVDEIDEKAQDNAQDKAVKNAKNK